jgi:hypothetical protein
MRAGAASLVVALLFATPALAQTSEPAVSFQSLWAALQKSPQSSLVIPPPSWIGPPSTRIGVLGLVPPDTNGEIVKVVVPIGELVSRAAHGVSSARRRRAERNAREQVTRELRELQTTRPTR